MEPDTRKFRDLASPRCKNNKILAPPSMCEHSLRQGLVEKFIFLPQKVTTKVIMSLDRISSFPKKYVICGPEYLWISRHLISRVGLRRKRKLTLKLFKCFKTFKTFQQKLSNRRERSCHEQKFYFLCCPFFFLITFSFIYEQLIA